MRKKSPENKEDIFFSEIYIQNSSPYAWQIDNIPLTKQINQPINQYLNELLNRIQMFPDSR